MNSPGKGSTITSVYMGENVYHFAIANGAGACSDCLALTERKVVGKSARGNPERYCGWFWVRRSSKKFERMAQEAVYVCLRVLKESNKRSFDSYSVRNRVLIISHIIFRDCRVPIFADNLSRNSCIWRKFGLVRRVTLPSQIRDQLGEPFF